jgi:hypothetical protein
MAATAATAPRADVRPLRERTNRHAMALLAAHAASLLAAGVWVWSPFHAEHHATPRRQGDLGWLDPGAASVTQMTGKGATGS